VKVSRSERGSTLLETVVVLGVVLALLFGVFEFGRALYTYGFVAQLARQGARWAIVRGSNCSQLSDCNATSDELQTYVRGISEGATIPSSIRATLNFGSCPYGAGESNAPGCVAEVTVSYPFAFVAPIVSQLSFNMSSTSEMVISN
jgi:hypothetical protein